MPPTAYSVLMRTPVSFVDPASSVLPIALVSSVHQLALHAIICMLEVNA